MNLPADRPLTQISAAFMAPSKRRVTVLFVTSGGRLKYLRYQQMPCHWGFSLTATSASTRAVCGNATVSHWPSSNDGEEAASRSARMNCQSLQNESASGSAGLALQAAKGRKAQKITLKDMLVWWARRSV